MLLVVKSYSNSNRVELTEVREDGVEASRPLSGLTFTLKSKTFLNSVEE